MEIVTVICFCCSGAVCCVRGWDNEKICVVVCVPLVARGNVLLLMTPWFEDWGLVPNVMVICV